MTAAAIPTHEFEARLKAIGATSTKDGNWTKVEFQVHPNDDVSYMLKAGLNSRWTVVVVLLDDQEQPVAIDAESPKPNLPAVAPAKERSRTKAAAVACKENAEFQGWLSVALGLEIGDTFGGTREKNAAVLVRLWCGVTSRAELDTDEAAGKRWDDLWFQFTQRENIR